MLCISCVGVGCFGVLSTPRASGRKRRRRGRRRKDKQGWIDSATHRNIQRSPNQVCSLPYSFSFSFFHPTCLHPSIPTYALCGFKLLFLENLWLALRQELSPGFRQRLATFFFHWVKNISPSATETSNWVQCDLWTTVLVFPWATSRMFIVQKNI